MRPATGYLRVTVFFLCTICYGQLVSIVPRTLPAHAEELPRSTFRLDVKLIEIPVSVNDQRDRPVLGLPQNRFRLFEDEAEQQIVSFSRTDAALSVGVVFDTSRSMKNRIQDTRAAIQQFLTTAAEGDEFSLVTFADSPELVSSFTPDTDQIFRLLSGVPPHGWTAMIDAIARSLGEIHKAANSRKVLLVLSDGGDNNSRYSEGELLSLARESDTRIFAIGLLERPRFLEKLAEETGGSVIWVHKMSELPEAMAKLSAEIRNEYRVGYLSQRNDGRYHKVRVEVSAPRESGPVRVSWRRGYRAP